MPIEQKDLDATVRQLLRAIASTKIHAEALSHTLVELNPLANTSILARHLATTQESWKETLRQIDEGSPQTLADVLQRFQGPVN